MYTTCGFCAGQLGGEGGTTGLGVGRRFAFDAWRSRAWAGLRPAAPDGLPVIGAASIEGLFYACGHFRNGIVLAPITARLVAGMLRGESGAAAGFDAAPFSPRRFEGTTGGA